MLACKNASGSLHKDIWQYIPVLLAWLLLLGSFGAWGAGFRVMSASTSLHDGHYLLNADIDFQLSTEVLEALNNSVPLTISLQIEIRQRRPLLWDAVVTQLQQRFRLEHHALAQQYVVTDLEQGTVRSFPTRRTAIKAIGRVRGLALLEQQKLQSSGQYYGRLRASLDIESLPAPLRPLAYLSASWRLSSEWYRWSLAS